MSVLNPFDFFLTPYAEEFPFKYDSNERRELVPYLVKAPATPLIENYLQGVSRERCRTIDFIVGINQRLAADIAYLIRLEPGVQQPEETLAKRSGSCRDSAALLVQLLRHLGLAARFVSGYLIQLVPDVKALDGPVGAKEDLHRSARLVRGVSTRCRLDRTRSHVGSAGGRGTYSPGLYAGTIGCGADQRRGRRVRDHLRTSHERSACMGSAARHQAL